MFVLSPQIIGGRAATSLYVIDADGTGLTLVIGGNDRKGEPTWVP